MKLALVFVTSAVFIFSAISGASIRTLLEIRKLESQIIYMTLDELNNYQV